MKRRADLFRRDARGIRELADEISRQVGHYERNGTGDEIRFLIIEIFARRLLKRARRARRRYELPR